MMLEELQRRNYSEDTTRFYIRTVQDFSRRFNQPPDRLGPRHIREYQAELFQKRKLSPGTHNGSVWPHDNSIVASGLAKYECKDMAGRILLGLLDASRWADLGPL